MTTTTKTATYLLYSHDKGVGELHQIDRNLSSEDWDIIRSAFARWNGVKPEDAVWVSVFRLYPHAVAEGLPYHEELAGPDGMSYMLVSFTDTTPEQLERAKQHIRRSYDVVRLTVLRNVNRSPDYSTLPARA